MLLTPRQTRALYEHAVENQYAILAVNADSPAAITDCLFAAEQCDAPIIIEASLWQLTGASFGAGDPILGIDRYVADVATITNSKRFKELPVVFHTDHIKGPSTLSILEHAIEKGVSSISLDSSELTDQQNIDYMGRLCEHAKSMEVGLTLEMEAGIDDGITPLEEVESLFGTVEKKHPGYLALWAPGVGTKHGLGSNTFSSDAVAEHRQLASKLVGRPIGIALHGSSGLSHDELRSAVSAGIAKVNWSSESLLLRSGAAREYYETRAERLDKSHPDFKETAMDNGVQSFVAEKYRPRVEERIACLNGSGFGSAFMKTKLMD